MKKSRWSIIHEDDDIIVINKPAGWLTLPDRFDPNKENLLKSLESYRGEIFVNHRLDRETSGLIVFSKNAESHKNLQDQFEQGEVDKHYLAIVLGIPPLEVGQIDLKLKYSNGHKRTLIDDSGKPSLTKFRILNAWDMFSLLEVKIMTGRTHQIRAHMKAIGHPLMCDELYGDGVPFLLSRFKRKYNRDQEQHERPLLSRTALHAFQLAFKHPSTGEDMHFEEDMPKDMRAVVYQLDKLSS